MKPIVVGIDGSAQGRLALDWAAAEAAVRNAPLQIVFGRSPRSVVPSSRMAGAPELYVPDDWAATADRELAGAASRAGELAPGIEVSVRREPVDPGRLLADLSDSATLVVVGSRGLGGIAGSVLGSVSLYLASHARSPVVVVRAEPGSLRGPEQRPEVLLGVDAHSPTSSAIEFAFAEASRRGIPLRAVHAWTHPQPAGSAEQPGGDVPPGAAAQDQARLLAEALAGWREKYPDVRVHAETRQDRPGSILAALSGQAELLVVGAHHRTHRIGSALGGVNHEVLHQALCPVVLVPDTE
ncbi:MAG TPA: universal stress protein [Actinomycetes bacterium]|nr:universal stress protein [Actinomycetes bacterium]